MITKLKAKNFTAFRELSIEFSPNINILIGENGTGKTHIMKMLYAASAVIDVRERRDIFQKLQAIFLPEHIGRLVHRTVGRSLGGFAVYRKDPNSQRDKSITCEISTVGKKECREHGWRSDGRISATYIPVKDMLANAPGFRSLYAEKHIHFEEIYSDIIDKALLPSSRGKQSPEKKKLLSLLNKAISGRVIEKNEKFFLKDKSGTLEFTLLAEGFRKLGLLYTLIQNDTLANGSILFWDEPEANLNPKLAQTVVRILMELTKIGVQIFIATHDYALLKEFDLATTDDMTMYHTLFRNDEGDIEHAATLLFEDITPNAIDEAYDNMLDREIQKEIR
jgi:ABC-type ATPase involved in cell division